MDNKLSRRERRKLARLNNKAFVPQYNGSEPKTYKEMFGIGYERFNDKFTKVHK